MNATIALSIIELAPEFSSTLNRFGGGSPGLEGTLELFHFLRPTPCLLGDGEFSIGAGRTQMSFISDINEARKLELARSQPSLNFLAFSPSKLLAEIHTDLFPDVRHTVRVDFVTQGPLACIGHTGDSASIYIHQLLNHSETPFAVISSILKHELLHLRIPSTSENGKEVQHSPEFWAAEREIAPERHSAWAWVEINLWTCLRRRPKIQRIDVRPNWKKVWNYQKTDIAICEQTIREQRAAIYGERVKEVDCW